jgi:hypothetical protein
MRAPSHRAHPPGRGTSHGSFPSGTPPRLPPRSHASGSACGRGVTALLPPYATSGFGEGGSGSGSRSALTVMRERLPIFPHAQLDAAGRAGRSSPLMRESKRGSPHRGEGRPPGLGYAAVTIETASEPRAIVIEPRAIQIVHRSRRRCCQRPARTASSSGKFTQFDSLPATGDSNSPNSGTVSTTTATSSQ